MARSRATAKKAGASFERLVADYLKATVSPFIDRKVKMGNKDCGDISNVLVPYQPNQSAGTGRVVVECKDTAKPSLGTWATEAEVERVNDRADVGLIVHKRHGVSTPGDQWVTCTLRDLATLLSGVRPS